TSGVSHPTPGLSRHAYQRAARDDQRRAGDEPAADELAAPKEHDGEDDSPERLGRHERRDDADATAVVGLEERRVGEAEEDSCGQEQPELSPVAAWPRTAARDDHVDG